MVGEGNVKGKVRKPKVPGEACLGSGLHRKERQGKETRKDAPFFESQRWANPMDLMVATKDYVREREFWEGKAHYLSKELIIPPISYYGLK